MEGEGRRGGMGWNVCRVIRGRGREGGRGLSAKCVDHNLLSSSFPLIFSFPFSSPSPAPLPSFLLLSLPSPPSLASSSPLLSLSSLPLQDYYKIGVVTCPSSESIQELREACDYLMIPFSEKTIRSQNLCKLAQEYVLVIYERY